jgi:hypothetical protein
MPNFILTKSSVIVCPHGGMVAHMPMSYPGELINGEVPMLFNDTYVVSGCSHFVAGSGSACLRVEWTLPSPTKRIGGIPVLINTSVGLCRSASGTVQGPAVVAAFQTAVTD